MNQQLAETESADPLIIGRSNLFTPFSQEDTLATGVGLGLSIVKSIVNMLNGSIDIRSEVGEGTEGQSVPNSQDNF